MLLLWSSSISGFLWSCGLRKFLSLWIPWKAVWSVLNFAVDLAKTFVLIGLQLPNVDKSKLLRELSFSDVKVLKSQD